MKMKKSINSPETVTDEEIRYDERCEDDRRVLAGAVALYHIAGAAAREEKSLDEEVRTFAARLTQAERQLAEEREKYRKLDETVGALHRMNENTESQALGGFKMDLADALRAVVRDASLPEAQGSAEILADLLDDCLDTLRRKGIPLEEE